MQQFIWDAPLTKAEKEKREADRLAEALAPRCHVAIGMHRCVLAPRHEGACVLEGLPAYGWNPGSYSE